MSEPIRPALSEAELLACPFCGGEPEFDVANDRAWWWVLCRDCGAHTGGTGHEAGAARAWNRRPASFTREDVYALRTAALEWQTRSRPNGDERLQSIADRLSALLRPREEKP